MSILSENEDITFIVNKIIRNKIKQTEKNILNSKTIEVYGEDFKLKIREKIIEECEEVLKSSSKDFLIEEIGDVLDVFDLTYEEFKMNKDEVIMIRKKIIQSQGAMTNNFLETASFLESNIQEQTILHDFLQHRQIENNNGIVTCVINELLRANVLAAVLKYNTNHNLHLKSYSVYEFKHEMKRLLVKRATLAIKCTNLPYLIAELLDILMIVASSFDINESVVIESRKKKNLERGQLSNIVLQEITLKAGSALIYSYLKSGYKIKSCKIEGL